MNPLPNSKMHMNPTLTLLASLGLAVAAQATTVGIPTATGSYALWDTFSDADPGYPALEFVDAAPTAVSDGAFSGLLSASMSGSVTGSGDRIYNGVAAASGAFGMTIDGTATAPLTELTLVLKMTPPSSGSLEEFFTVMLDGTATTGTFLGSSGENLGMGGDLSLVAYSWSGLSIGATDSFHLSLTSPADGHVSLDALQLSQGVIPEPSVALLGGLGLLGCLRRRR